MTDKHKPAGTTKARRVKRLERTAYHEAGHAVAAYHNHVFVRYVSIEPEEDSLGHCERGPFGKNFRPDCDAKRHTRAVVERSVIVSLAGPAAEARFAGRNNYRGARGDNDNAMELAICVCGSAEERGAYVNWLRIRAKELVEKYWPEVQAVAAELMAHRRLGSRRVRKIIKDNSLRAIAEARFGAYPLKKSGD